MEERPSAVLALNSPKVNADLALQIEVVRFTQVVAQEDVFGRNGGVCFQFEHPVPIGALACEKGLGGQIDRAIDAQERVGDHQC